MELVGNFFEVDSAKYRAFFQTQWNVVFRAANSESLVANIVTFNVVTIKHKLSKLLLEYKVNL